MSYDQSLQHILIFEVKLIMNYQDHATKFCLLRPLKIKRAAEVPLELLKIFLDFGAPYILQSDNGCEFIADEINELSDMWPDCKIVHGRSRHPRSQVSMERCNEDIQNMLRAWMDVGGNTDCVTGCRFVQRQNVTYQNSGRSLYTTLFRREPK
ncbi:KRAB-A domain-containing protein 2 [Araneus ventricosus]|uniref:KRAB-A domain-containing protein 2 n=1 Tax=Araneus ventricosus TaxID=182803 RepID=A0A4Y2LZ36_ARAVE|nr:KRAB-A domain-containing protein 2 [Araneus ventricosus]